MAKKPKPKKLHEPSKKSLWVKAEIGSKRYRKLVEKDGQQKLPIEIKGKRTTGGEK